MRRSRLLLIHAVALLRFDFNVAAAMPGRTGIPYHDRVRAYQCATVGGVVASTFRPQAVIPWYWKKDRGWGCG